MRDAIHLPGDGVRSGHCGIGMGALAMENGVRAMSGVTEATGMRRFATEIEGEAIGVRDRGAKVRNVATVVSGGEINAPISAMEARRKAMSTWGRAMRLRVQAKGSPDQAMSIRALAIETSCIAIEDWSLAIGTSRLAMESRGLAIATRLQATRARLQATKAYRLAIAISPKAIATRRRAIATFDQAIGILLWRMRF
jgi:hypothetical protein